jgi:hypothetical protein
MTPTRLLKEVLPDRVHRDMHGTEGSRLQCIFNSVTLKPPKLWHPFTKLKSVTFQKTVLFKFCFLTVTNSVLHNCNRVFPWHSWLHNDIFYKLNVLLTVHRNISV